MEKNERRKSETVQWFRGFVRLCMIVYGFLINFCHQKQQY